MMEHLMTSKKVLLTASNFSVANIKTYIRNQRCFISAGVVLSIILGIAVCFMTTPYYRAELLLENRVSGALRNVIDMGFQSLPQSRESAQREIELLSTYDVLAEVVKRQHLDISQRITYTNLLQFPMKSRSARLNIDQLILPESIKKKLIIKVISPTTYQVLMPGSKSTLTGKVGEPLHVTMDSNKAMIIINGINAPAGMSFIVKKLAMDKAIKRLRKQLKINRGALYTDLITVQLKAKDPERAAALLNTLAQVASEKSEQRKQQDATAALGYLQREERSIAKDLNNTEQKLNDLRMKLQTLVPEYENKVLMSQLATLEDKLQKVEQQRAIMSQSVTPNHPNSQALDKLYLQLKEHQKRMKASIQLRPDNEDAISDLVRLIQVKTKIYQLINYQITQLNIIKSGAIGDLTILQPAIVPQLPSSLNPWLILLLFALGGTLVSVVLAIFRASLLEKIHPKQLESLFDLPTYASITARALQSEIKTALAPLLQAIVWQANLGHRYWAVTALRPQTGLNTLLKILLKELSQQSKRILVLEVAANPVFKRSEASSTLDSLYTTVQSGVDSLIIEADSHWLMPQHRLQLAELVEQYDLVMVKVPATAKSYLELWLQLLPVKLLLLANAQRDTVYDISNLVNILTGKGFELHGFVVNQRLSAD